MPRAAIGVSFRVVKKGLSDMNLHLDAARAKPIPLPAPRQALTPKQIAFAAHSVQPPAGEPDPSRTRAELIAEAAYCNAERRGFAPGAQWRHWLEAETAVEPARKN
jgi:hypothetical protein